ncbi:hypothetical protein GCM10018965_046470 [Nonomuraea roseola]
MRATTTTESTTDDVERLTLIADIVLAEARGAGGASGTTRTDSGPRRLDAGVHGTRAASGARPVRGRRRRPGGPTLVLVPSPRPETERVTQALSKGATRLPARGKGGDSARRGPTETDDDLAARRSGAAARVRNAGASGGKRAAESRGRGVMRLVRSEDAQAVRQFGAEEGEGARRGGARDRRSKGGGTRRGVARERALQGEDARRTVPQDRAEKGEGAGRGGARDRRLQGGGARRGVAQGRAEKGEGAGRGVARERVLQGEGARRGVAQDRAEKGEGARRGWWEGRPRNGAGAWRGGADGPGMAGTSRRRRTARRKGGQVARATGAPEQGVAGRGTEVFGRERDTRAGAAESGPPRQPHWYPRPRADGPRAPVRLTRRGRAALVVVMAALALAGMWAGTRAGSLDRAADAVPTRADLPGVVDHGNAPRNPLDPASG